jgi:hypothetical protein
MHTKCYLEKAWTEKWIIYIIDLIEIGFEGVELFHRAREMILWQALVNMV